MKTQYDGISDASLPIKKKPRKKFAHQRERGRGSLSREKENGGEKVVL